MSGKNLNFLIAVFVVLVLLVAAKIYMPGFTKPKSMYVEKTKGLAKDSVQKVEISKSPEKVLLTKDGSDWKIDNRKADKTKVENLLAFLLTANAPEQVAQTDKRHGDFEVTADKATKVSFDDKTVFLLGKSSGDGAYVRFDGSPEVYLLPYPPSYTTTPSDWYDKTVIAVDRDKVTKITFKEPGGTLVLTKKDDKWLSDKDGKEAKKEKADSVLLALTELTAQSFYDPASKTVYPKIPAMTLTLDYDGKSESLEFYKGESDYLVRRVSDDSRFIVSETSVSPILSAPKELF